MEVDAPAESNVGPPAPHNPPIRKHPALLKCTVHGTKGSSFIITCEICGLGGESGLTTSLHKLTYGHYLHEPKNDITACVSRAVLESSHPEWFTKLTDLEGKLFAKRK
jgi:hypothetical protein